MNILSISTDRAILQDKHGARIKAQWLASTSEHTHLVLFTTDRLLPDKITITDQLTVYPTRSRHALLYVIDAQRIVRRIVSQHAIDVITTQDPFLTGLVGVWVKTRCVLPLQVQVHTDISNPEFFKHSYSNKIRMAMSRYVLPRANRVRVVSHRVAIYVQRRYPHLDTVVLPVWVNFPKILGAQKVDLHSQYNSKTVVVTASRLEKEKHIDCIIDAFGCVSTKEQVLIIIGSGSLEDVLKSQVQESSARDRIHFISWTENLPSYLKGSDVYVSASAYEGFGLSLVEAALSGCRIVSTPVGVIGYELSSDIYQAPKPHNLRCALEQAIHVETSSQLKEEAQFLCINKEEYLEQYHNALMIQ